MSRMLISRISRWRRSHSPKEPPSGPGLLSRPSQEGGGRPARLPALWVWAGDPGAVGSAGGAVRPRLVGPAAPGGGGAAGAFAGAFVLVVRSGLYGHGRSLVLGGAGWYFLPLRHGCRPRFHSSKLWVSSGR